MNNLNFAFWGTPDIASRTLDILFDNGYLPLVIITSPDKPAGRGLHLTPSPVSKWAEAHNITCLKPEKITPEFIEKLSAQANSFRSLPRESASVDLYVVVAYGKILPDALIKTPELGTINIHYSLLPKYRGASPLESALLNGDETTGVSIQQMEFKLDSGPIIAEKEIAIGINETKEELRNSLIKMGGDLLCETLPKILNKTITLKKQDEEKATYCKKINKEDGELDLTNDSIKNYNKYRAYFGWPGTYFFITKKDKKIRVKIKLAILKDDQFIIKRVIPEGKKEIDYEDFLKQN